MRPHETRTEAFHRIYVAHYGQVVAYARRRLGDDEADDVVAETFTVAWRRLEDMPGDALTLPWLYAVARRVVSQIARSGRRRNRLIARLIAARDPQEEVVMESDRSDDRAGLLAAMRTLRPNDQELLMLSEWEGLTPPEIGLAVGCSTNAASIRLHRARKSFSRAFASIDNDPTEEQEMSQ